MAFPTEHGLPQPLLLTGVRVLKPGRDCDIGLCFFCLFFFYRMLFTLLDLGARAELPVQCHPPGLGGLEKAHGAGEVSWSSQELQSS